MGCHDRNWWIYAAPLSDHSEWTPHRNSNAHVRKISGEEAPNAEITTQNRGKYQKKGQLTPAECKHRMDNNLCLYCGKPGHRAIACTEPLLCSACLAPLIFPNYPLTFPLHFSVLFHLLIYQTPWTAILTFQTPLKPCLPSHLPPFCVMTRSLNPVACILGCTRICTVWLIALKGSCLRSI